MKIVGTKSTVFAAAESRPLPGTKRPATAANGCLVELHTDEGLTGIAIGPGSIEGVIDPLVGDTLLGHDPRAVVKLWQTQLLGSGGKHRDDRIAGAIAALDTALWDLKAKANDEPLWKTLGGSRPRANTHVSCIDSSLSNAELARWIDGMVAEFRFYEAKLSVGNDTAADLTRLGILRDALTSGSRDAVLAIDAGSLWTQAQAIERIAALEAGFDLTWVESPVDFADVAGMRQVSDAVYAAVCGGAELSAPADYVPYFRKQALDIVQIAVSRTGITGALQIADAAFGLELPVTLTATPGNIGAHLAAAMPNFMSMEVVHPQESQGFLVSDIRIRDGRATAGDVPGLGLAIDPERLQAAIAENRQGSNVAVR